MYNLTIVIYKNEQGVLSRDGVGGTGSEAELVQIRHWVIFSTFQMKTFQVLVSLKFHCLVSPVKAK